VTDIDQHPAGARDAGDPSEGSPVEPDLTVHGIARDDVAAVLPGRPVVTADERAAFLVALHGAAARTAVELESHGYRSKLLEERLTHIETTLSKQHPASWAARHEELIDRNSRLWHVPDGCPPGESCRICDRGLPNQIHPDDLPRSPR
jgi:hypothetical protein